MAKKAKKKKKIQKNKMAKIAKKSQKKKKKAKAASRNTENVINQTPYLIASDGTGDEQFLRIFDILGVDNEDAEVNDKNLETYLAYLEKEIELPINVTGMHDMGCFGWEEYYTFGPGDPKEYEKKKKKYASFRDKYELLKFDDDYDAEHGLFVIVKRISDQRKFTLTLCDLKAVDENSREAQILDDFATWHTNFI